MKSLALMFWIASAVCKIQIEETKNDNSLPLAFENVTKHLFQLETRMFINNYDVDSNTMTWLLFESLNKNGMPFKLQNLDIHHTENILLDSSAFVTFDSLEKLRDFNEKLTLINEFYKPIQFFIYCQSATIDDIKSLAKDVSKRNTMKLSFPECKPGVRAKYESGESEQSIKMCEYRQDLRDIIQYEYFLVDEATSVKLMTFLWFSPGKCGELHLTQVNKFNKLTKKWENNKFVLQKLENLHNCEIGYDTKYQFRPSDLDKIPTILSSHLNYRETEALKSIGNIVTEKHCYDHSEFLIREEFIKDFSLGVYLAIITFPVDYMHQRLAVPPGGFYNEYEKLIMPFDFFTWAMIASTFAASFLMILILYFVERSIRDFVIGSNITTPALNVIQIFFGIAQAVLPKRNFARYLTMLFIMFCLIIRTAWQAKIYEFMQKDVAKPELQTVDEMIEQGYTFYMEEFFAEHNPELEISKRGTFETYYERNEIELKIFRPGFKGALQTNLTHEAYMAKKTKGRFAERVRKEVLLVEMCGLGFSSHDPFFGIFDLKTQQLFSAGIIQYMTEQVWKEQIRNQTLKYLVIKGPRVLTMKMLEPGFVIWSTSLTFTVIAFVLEWLITLKDYIVAKYILRTFFQMQNSF